VFFSFRAKFFHNMHWPNSRVFGVFPKIENANRPFSRELGRFSSRLLAERLAFLSSDVRSCDSFSVLSSRSRLPGGTVSIASDNDFTKVFHDQVPPGRRDLLLLAFINSCIADREARFRKKIRFCIAWKFQSEAEQQVRRNEKFFSWYKKSWQRRLWIANFKTTPTGGLVVREIFEA
jgi:hypothetical protein